MPPTCETMHTRFPIVYKSEGTEMENGPGLQRALIQITSPVNYFDMRSVKVLRKG